MQEPTTAAAHPTPGKRVLEPVERLSEILFGLIMVLTFTGSLSIADAGRDDVRVMLIGALGCNLAWGIIDAVLYLMACLAEKGRGLQALRALHRDSNAAAGQRLVAEALPPTIASVLRPDELEAIRQRLRALPGSPSHPRLHRDEWRGAFGVFLLVFLSTFPVVIPFLVMQQVGPAMRVSNTIAVAMMFATGAAYARLIGRRPWTIGVAMVLLGAALVALTMALGG